MSTVLPAADSGLTEAAEDEAARSKSGFWALTLGSAGVVYGDIGTSPLYAFRAAIVAAAPGGEVMRGTVIGVLSLIIWALIIIVTMKYVMVLLRADNRGEGGTLALMALAQKAVGKGAGAVVLLGIVSAALFYGDAAITPALSVLSAIEGLKLVTPEFNNYIVPLTVLVLICLFAFEHRGTATIAIFFGPITAVWFVVIGIAGAVHVAADPGVLAAFNPLIAIEFFANHGFIGLVTLGAVFLAVTGAEALYADLGHFGRRPIQTAWLGLVLPSLTINYLGQGALILADPSTIRNPFFLMFPHWAVMPMVLLATAATVIASQAVISGAYSLSRQAIHLGLLPRLEVRHTSAKHPGQVYLPLINWILLSVVLLLVIWFGSSNALASAYGIAVNGTMVMTCLLAFIVVRKVWGWSLPATVALIVPFLLIDMGFLVANLLKVAHGGWVPLAFGGMIVVVMYAWRWGNKTVLNENVAANVSQLTR